MGGDWIFGARILTAYRLSSSLLNLLVRMVISLPTGSSYLTNMHTRHSQLLRLLVSSFVFLVVLQGCGIYDRSSASILAEPKPSFSSQKNNINNPTRLEAQVQFKYHLKGFNPEDISYKIIANSRSRQEYQLLQTSDGLLEVVYIRTIRPLDIIDFEDSLRKIGKNWKVFKNHKVTWGKSRLYDSLSGEVNFRAARLNSEGVVCVFFQSEQDPLSKDHFDRPRRVLIGYYCDLTGSNIDLVMAHEILDAIELIGVPTNSYILGSNHPNPTKRLDILEKSPSYVLVTEVGYKEFPLNITTKAKLEGSVLKE